MRTSSAFAGLLLLSSTTSKMEAEGAPPIGIVKSASKGFFTGALCSGIKKQISEIQTAINPSQPDIDKDSDNKNATKTNGEQSFIPKVAKRVVRSFPIDLGSNAAATAYTDRLFAQKAETLNNIKSLGLPTAAAVVTRELIKDTNIPKPIKGTAPYGAFLMGRFLQRKNPLLSTAAVTAYAVGATAVKTATNRAQNKASQPQEEQQEPEDLIIHEVDTRNVLSRLLTKKPSAFSERTKEEEAKSKEIRKSYARAVTGYLPSNSRDIGDNAKNNAEDMLKKKIGIPPETQLWPLKYDKFSGSYSSYLVPIDEKDLPKGFSR